MTAAAPRLWPLAPLLNLTGHTGSSLSVHIGISGSTIARARHDGLTDRQAELWSWACGLFPHEVWGWAWHQWALDNLPDDDEETVAA